MKRQVIEVLNGKGNTSALTTNDLFILVNETNIPLDVYVTGGTIVNGPNNPENKIILNRNDGDEIVLPNLVDIVNITKDQIENLINSGEIIRGKTYKISFCDRNLYDNGYDLETNNVFTTIYLTGLESDKLTENGVGIFYTPRYSDYSIFVDGENYVSGDMVIWGGNVWRCLVSGNYNYVDIFTLPFDNNEFEKLYPFNNSDYYDDSLYNEQYDEIIYDYENDVIIYRNEENTNIVSTNIDNINYWIGSGFYNPIKSFQWGRVYDGNIGIGNQKIINSYNENINFNGEFQTNFNFNNLSYQRTLITETPSSSSQTNFEFTNGSFQDNVTLLSSIYQAGLTFNNSSQFNGTIFENQQNMLINNFGIDLSTFSFIQSQDLIVLNNLPNSQTTTYVGILNNQLIETELPDTSFTGGTVSGATNFTSGLTANTISTNSLSFESSDDEIILSKQVTNWWLDGNTLNVGGNESSPSGIFFNPDGDKLFIIGTTGDDITPYNLSTPWDLTTATVTTPTYLISGETNPIDLYFKPDGTKMYVIGSSSDLVREFTLSDPWNFNSVIVGPTLSVSGQDNTPTGLFFKPDGSKMYVVGDTNDKVYEYDMPVAWDLTFAFFNGYEFSLSSRETSVSSISFNNDGTIMYVLGGTGDDITQYNLSNAWNISSAQYCCQSFTFLQENFPNGLYYNEDVEKAFVVGSSVDNVIGLNTDKQLFFDYGSATVNGQLFVDGRLESTDGFYVNGNSGVLGNLTVSSLFNSLGIKESTSTITLGTSNTTSFIIDGPTAEDSRITIGNQRITSGYTRTINIGNNGYLGSETDIVLGSSTPLGTINNTLPTIFGQTVNINGQLIVDNKKTPLVSSNTATGVTVVYDTFTETSNTLLNLHTPDTGSTWSRVQISTFTTATFTVFGSTDTMGPTANLTDQGVIYRQDTVLTESDYEVSVNLSTQDSSDDVMWLFARFIDVNNFYGVRWSTTSTNCGLYKRVNGTYTLLSLLVINPITGSTSLTLRVYSGYIIVLNGGNIVITAYDKDITSPGYAAIGAGNIGLTSTDDFDSTWKFDNFKVQYYTQNYDNTIITNGNLLIGTQTNIPSSKLTVESTTQGFLPPRMTGVQMSGITTPSIGLMVYQTDSTEGLYVYSSTGWRRLNWS